MQLNEKALQLKGWTEEEIAHTKEIWEKARKNRKKHHIMHEKATYWILLILLILGAFAVELMVVPLLVVFSTLGASIALGIVGALYGILASVLVADLEHLGIHHHVLISIIIPITTIAVSLLIFAQLNQVLATGVFDVHHNPIIVASSFSVASLIPYIIFLVRK